MKSYRPTRATKNSFRNGYFLNLLILVFLFTSGCASKQALKKSITSIDGVFTYLVTTTDQLGMAKDSMAAKPMVLYETDEMVALASEEVAIRAVVPHEIDTWDPYDEEVRVWQA